MNRRRGPTGASPDDRVGRREGPARPPGSRRAGVGGRGRRDQNPPTPATSSRIGVRALLFLLFGSLVAVEYAAYKTLGAGPAPSPPVDAGGARHLTPAADSNDNHVPSDPRGQANPRNATAAAPTRRPSAAAADPESQSTYSPTAQRKGWRVKSARRASRSNSAWWKARTPDPLPPLPPDVDPETGEKLPPVVAYVTTLTKCGPKHRGGLDGAAVLLHSIRRNSFGWTPDKVEEDANDAGGEAANDRPKHGGNGGRYRHRAYVIVDPAASPDNPNKSGECARFLLKVGYIVLHRPPLVPLFPIDDGDVAGASDFYKQFKEGGYVASRRPETGPTARRPGEGPDHLRLMMSDDGCCGYTELLKLHVYGLVGHPLAVHLDFDSLLLRPMDDLFDAMLGRAGSPDEAKKKVRLASLPKSKSVDFSVPIGSAFTRDYNSVVRPSPSAPVGYQGGFLVVRPDLNVLDDYRDILLRGEFMLGPRKGWENVHGGFYGDVTFQGILPYYYETYAPGRGAERRGATSAGAETTSFSHNEAELDRCVYNQMADNPRKSTYKFPRATPLDPDAMGFRDTDTCRDGRKDCSDTDCQRVDPEETVSAHFTFCGKPWDCSEGNPGTVASETCRSLLGEWYAVRRELEVWWTAIGSGAGGDGGDGEEGGASYREEVTRGRVAESRRGGLGGGDGGVARLGYCDSVGTDGYRRLVEPDGPIA